MLELEGRCWSIGAGAAVLVLELEGRDRVEAGVLVLELEYWYWSCKVGAGVRVGARIRRETDDLVLSIIPDEQPCFDLTLISMLPAQSCSVLFKST